MPPKAARGATSRPNRPALTRPPVRGGDPGEDRRRGFVVLVAPALALGLSLVSTGPVARAAGGFDSSYQFESAFLALQPGETGSFSVFFLNSGATAWVRNTSSQVNLAVCAADKVTCNVTSTNAAFASGWYSPIAYATHAKDVVAPGDASAFTWSARVPAGQPNGTYRFNGDIVLAATGERLRPEGYYHDLAVGQTSFSLAVTPDYSRDEYNEGSAAVPGNGQHTYTFTTTLAGTLTFATIPYFDVTQNGSGGFTFSDRTQDRKAGGVGAGSVLFTAVNGGSVPPGPVLVNQPTPGDG